MSQTQDQPTMSQNVTHPFFARPKAAEETPKTLAQRIEEYLKQHPYPQRKTARQIATALGMDKKQINPVLYHGRHSTFERWPTFDATAKPEWSARNTEGVVVVPQAPEPVPEGRPAHVSECPICGQGFVNVELHKTKAHKRDMWKVVIPADIGDDWKLFHFGVEVSSQPWSAGSDATQTESAYVETSFYPEGALTPFASGLHRSNPRAEAIIAILKVTDGEDGKPLAKDKSSMTLCYAMRPHGEVFEGVDVLNWSVEFE